MSAPNLLAANFGTGPLGIVQLIVTFDTILVTAFGKMFIHQFCRRQLVISGKKKWTTLFGCFKVADTSLNTVNKESTKS